MLSSELFDYCALYSMLSTNRVTQCHGQKLVFSIVKSRFDESSIVQVLSSPPVLHDSRAYVNLISRGLWNTYLNLKGFWLTHSSEIVRYNLCALTVLLYRVKDRWCVTGVSSFGVSILSIPPFWPNKAFCSAFCVSNQIEMRAPNSSVHQFRVETQEVMNRAPDRTNTNNLWESRY